MHKSLLAAFAAGLAFAGLTVGQSVAQDTMGADREEEIASDPGLDLGDPRTGRIGQVSAWLFYSSEYGITGGASGKLNFPSGDGTSVSIGAEVAEQRQSARLGFHQDAAFDTQAAWDLTLRGSHQEARKSLPFQSASAGLEARLTWPQGISGYLGVANNRIYEPTTALSAIILPDLQRSERRYAGVNVAHTAVLGDGALSKLKYSLGGELAAISTGANQFRSQADLLAGGSLNGDALSWQADLRAGVLTTSNGSSSIGERFILGGASLRGFAFGGFGPHDGAQSLGGNRYALARFDLRMHDGFGENAWVVPGVHADFGSLWGLDNTGGGLVDASAKLRGSIGVTLTAKLPNGGVSLSVSKALLTEVGDETQMMQLGLYSKF